MCSGSVVAGFLSALWARTNSLYFPGSTCNFTIPKSSVPAFWLAYFTLLPSLYNAKQRWWHASATFVVRVVAWKAFFAEAISPKGTNSIRATLTVSVTFLLVPGLVSVSSSCPMATFWQELRTKVIVIHRDKIILIDCFIGF